MPPTPPETTSKIRQHDNDIAEIYAKLTTIERKADAFRTELHHRFDRIEARAQGVDVGLTGMGTTLAQIGTWLDQIDGDLRGLTSHLSTIDTHLVEMDSTFAEVLRRLPGDDSHGLRR